MIFETVHVDSLYQILFYTFMLGSVTFARLKGHRKSKQVGQAIYTFVKSRSCEKWHTVVASLMLVACFVVEIIQH